MSMRCVDVERISVRKEVESQVSCKALSCWKRGMGRGKKWGGARRIGDMHH